MHAVSRNLAAANGELVEIRLPPLDAGLTPEVMRALASIYFQSELEQTGLLALAETLATNRGSLALQNAATAGKLEEFAQRMRRWPGFSQRQDLYGRLFTHNYEFQRLFANLCLRLTLVARDFDFGRGLRTIDEAQLRRAALAVLNNLGGVQTGSSVSGGQAIQQQFTAAIDMLRHPGMLAHFAARNLWGVIRASYGDETPDLARLLSRGRAGMRVLTWLAGVMLALDDARPAGPLIGPRDSVLVEAAAWLQASGLGG
jgi:hypothetical protein